ncbi:hypothetical protein C8R46DRAFT_1061934 [Mycena filopes]|nr:hypothetical protein C8R46DRAFT_1061934 [Mycena filopes]
MLSAFICWVGLASLAHAQTLLLVSPLQTGPVTILETGILSISPLGVGADGMTTYLEVGAETLAVEISGTVTQTLVSTPVPYTATFVEDASRFMIGASGTGLSESCTFGADGQGACVQEFVFPGGSATSTTTYSGPVQPWYTLNAAAAATSAPSASGFSTSPSQTSQKESQTAPSSPGPSSPSSSTPSSATACPNTWTRWATGIILVIGSLHAF